MTHEEDATTEYLRSNQAKEFAKFQSRRDEQMAYSRDNNSDPRAGDAIYPAKQFRSAADAEAFNQTYRGVAVTPNPPGQVGSSLDTLDVRVSRVQDRVKLLEHRLLAVLAGVPPANCGGAPSCVDIAVPMSARINGQSQILDEVGDALDSIIGRLEL